MTGADSEDRGLAERLALTAQLDEVRRTDFARLDAGGHVYLDHTGAALYPVSLVEEHLALLRSSVLGNPHSDNPTSRPMTELVERARSAVLRFVSADPERYECIFTQNASGAIRLVGEAFPFGPDRPLVLSADNHNSVNGIREMARTAGAPITYVPLVPPALRLDPVVLRGALDGPPGLLALPAQSNYSGVRHPLPEVPDGWRTLYDAAAFAPTNRLDLDAVRPDFVALSFYKIFGYPTGVGALIARRDALEELHRPWFAGGTIAIASVRADGHRLVPGHAGFEDGTLDFLAMPAIDAGIAFMERLGMDVIHDRVMALTRWSLVQMTELRHRNGVPLVRVLGPRDATGRGATIAFVLSDPSGDEIPDRLVERIAAGRGISVRTGCFCNPGAGETARDVAAADLRPFLDDVVPVSSCAVDEAIRHRRGRGVSALRVSFGMSSNAADARALVDLLRSLLDRPAGDLGPPPPAGDVVPDSA